VDPQHLGETPPEAGQLPGADAAGKHFRVNARGDSAGAPRARKSTARFLWAAFSLFVVYGTTFPFDFPARGQSLAALFQRINWLPLGGRPGDIGFPDIIQNILLFLPFGFLGYFSLIQKRSRLKKTAIVLSGAALSASVEFLQIFSPLRYPALSDVIFNTVGTLLGLWAGIILKKSVLGFKSHPLARRLLDTPSAYPAVVFLILTVAGAWVPFDFSLEVSTVWGHIKPLLRDPLHFGSLDDAMITYIRYLLATLFVARTLHEAGLPRPVLAGTAAMAALALGLEASQVIIASRFPELGDAAVGVLGTVCGGLLFFSPGFHRRPRVWTGAGGLVIFLSAASYGWRPYRFSSRFSGFAWVPFQAHFQGGTFAALGDFLESGMVFFPLGFLLGYFYPRKRLGPLAASLAGVLALVVEVGQGFVAGRYADITDVLGAMLGATAGVLAMTRGWPAFREYMREDEDRQV
jgi:glycopeptide antibiotics resistance protein